MFRAAYSLIDKYNGRNLLDGTLSMVMHTVLVEDFIEDMNVADFNGAMSLLTKNIADSAKKAGATGQLSTVTTKDYTDMPIDQMFIRILREYKAKNKALLALGSSSELDLRGELISEFKDSHNLLKRHLSNYYYHGSYTCFIQYAQTVWGLSKMLKELPYREVNAGDEKRTEAWFKDYEKEVFENAHLMMFKGKREVKGKAPLLNTKLKDKELIGTQLEERESADRRCKWGVHMFLKIEHYGIEAIMAMEGFDKFINKRYAERKRLVEKEKGKR
jgi:hypothetical protein